MWGSAGRFVAAIEDEREIQSLHIPKKENAKDVQGIVEDMEQFFDVPAVELLSSGFTGVHACDCSPFTAHLAFDSQACPHRATLNDSEHLGCCSAYYKQIQAKR